METLPTIASRIIESRKKLGITIKELAARTKEFSPARIGNWEQGIRNPGPNEALVLSKILGVSPSYLLCLSDDPRGDLHLQSDFLPRYVPLIPLKDARLSAKQLKDIIDNMSPYADDENRIALDKFTNKIAGPNTFATIVEDNSMSPDLNPGDIVIIDRDAKVKPGQLVVAHYKQEDENIIRKFKQINPKSNYQLVPSNSDWGTLEFPELTATPFLGVVIERRMYFQK